MSVTVYRNSMLKQSTVHPELSDCVYVQTLHKKKHVNKNTRWRCMIEIVLFGARALEFLEFGVHLVVIVVVVLVVSCRSQFLIKCLHRNKGARVS